MDIVHAVPPTTTISGPDDEEARRHANIICLRPRRNDSDSRMARHPCKVKSTRSPPIGQYQLGIWLYLSGYSKLRIRRRKDADTIVTSGADQMSGAISKTSSDAEAWGDSPGIRDR